MYSKKSRNKRTEDLHLPDEVTQVERFSIECVGGLASIHLGVVVDDPLVGDCEKNISHLLTEVVAVSQVKIQLLGASDVPGTALIQ